MIAEEYPLQESVLLDSGATLHIFRDTKRMKSLRAAPIGDFLWSGTTQVPIDGYGEARIILKSGDGSPTYLTLYNVALCTALTTNLVSFSKLRKRGYWWDTKPGNNCLRRADGSYLGEVEEINGQQVLEYRTSYEPAATLRAALIAEVSSKPRQRKQHTSWTPRRPLKGDSLTWHKRLGHPGPEVLRYLTTASRGVRIKGDTPKGPQRITTVNCDACGTAKAHRLIRRAPRQATARARPGDRIAIDFHPLTLGYAGYTSEQPSQWTTQLPDEEHEEVLNDEDIPCSDQLAQQDASTSEEDQHAKLPPRGEEGDGSTSEYTTSRFEVLPTPPPSPPTAFFHAEAFGLGVKGRGGSLHSSLAAYKRRNTSIGAPAK
ncbi:uncharacterized protein FPOAC1_013968 [Fusarium poae]|uniref:uncharacterized protein n=1 Tax=Fusarium poae TaxID=36050 RepID=UPI001D03B436|nr:uncharacterized protein FPOAC1_013968 [Fusarium poae]KAG8664261.1 hypothetical protein FPOAC1_013968 [Fusarium poae]